MLAYQIMILRKRAGISQLQLANKLNIGPSAIGMYEQGRRTPSVEMLTEMAKLFEVSLDYLITGTESTHPIADKNETEAQLCCLGKTHCCCCCKRMLR